MDSCFSDDMGVHPFIQFSGLEEQSCARQIQHRERHNRPLGISMFQELGSHVGNSYFDEVLGSTPVSALLGRLTEIAHKEPSLVRANSSVDFILGSLSDLRGESINLSGDVVTKNNGLVRSQSYPPKGFQGHTRKYLLKVGKIAQNPIVNFLHDNVSCATLSKVDQQIATSSSMMDELAEVCFSQTKEDEKYEHISVCSTKQDYTLKSEGENISEGLETSRESSSYLYVEEGSSLQNVSYHGLNCCPHCSKVLECGRRKEMEDMAAIVPSFTTIPCGMMGMCPCDKESPDTTCDLHFFAVYDGHGGSQASSYCFERFHHLLAEELRSMCMIMNAEGDHRSQWEKLMMNCFSKVDMEVGGICPSGMCYEEDLLDSNCVTCEDAISPENVGTTAVVAVVGSHQIVLANCGDSRAVLSRGGKAIPLSTDHKPERDDETSRIEAAGGKIIYYDGYRVGGFLALSRAIGDRYLKPYVISDPEVTCVEREQDDECLILASDGLWDVISNDHACEVARRGLAAKRKRDKRSFPHGEDPASSFVATTLAKLAHSKGSKDNISVIVVDLKS